MKIKSLRDIRISKTWAVLGIALLVGLVAALAARSYLARQMDEIEARSKGKTVSIVVAKRALKRGDVLDAETVAVRAIPIAFGHAAAVSPGDFERVRGQRLAFEVGAGEMILWSLLESKRAPTFSANVEAGRRAMTVPVDEISSISGMLEPGDVIDLMVTVDREGRKVTFALLQGVNVMATGQRAVDDPKGGAPRQFATVTLDTTPEDAQRVIVAREAGRITALLRNPKDKRLMASTRGDIDALLGLTAKAPAPARDSRVPVLYGGQAGLFPDDALNIARRPGPGPASPAAGAGPPGAPPASASAQAPAPESIGAAVQAAIDQTRREQ